MVNGICRDIAIPLAFLEEQGRFQGRVEGDCIVGDLIVERGRIAGLTPSGGTVKGLVTPRLTEPHCHLDKCHTIGRLPATGGSLQEAIAVQESDKVNWTVEDIRQRAERGLQELVQAGCGFVRTHVDCRIVPGNPAKMPLAWEVLGEVAQDWRARIIVQRAALFPIDSFTDLAVAKIVARRIAKDGGALGAFVLGQPDREAGIVAMVRAARDIGIPLDFHVDEGAGASLDGLALIGRTVLSEQLDRPVLCGHACSLMDLAGDDLDRRLDLVAAAGLAIVSLPASNLLLQSRGRGTPDRRGITRVRELAARGIPISFGSDNVRDAFAPIGWHDPLQSLSLGILAAQLAPPLSRWLACITSDARRGVEGSASGLPNMDADDVLFWPVSNVSDLLSQRPTPGRLPLQPH